MRMYDSLLLRLGRTGRSLQCDDTNLPQGLKPASFENLIAALKSAAPPKV